jgi:Putative prokaryotic signal transducing protein
MLRRFRDLPDPLAVKSILDSAGIECLLGDENVVRLDWFWSNLVGGVKLWVRQQDMDQAENLIEQSIPEEFSVEGVGDFKQPRCPICGSFDVSLEQVNKSVALISASVGLPIPLKPKRWRCRSCGHSGPMPNDGTEFH